jgi:hypothetical protein
MSQAFPDNRRSDQVAKVFRVEQPWRRCLVCEQLFTQQGSRKHAEVVCHPVREIAGAQKRLYDPAGRSIATYRPNVNFTYDNNGSGIGSGNRLAGMVGDDEA